ncbi:MAG: hypothetical protein ACTSSH_11065 [Candidatus Heimdallarchaeota archaeon]
MVQWLTFELKTFVASYVINILMKYPEQQMNCLFVQGVKERFVRNACLEAIKNYTQCPAAGLLGVDNHELKIVKLLPPKPMQITGQIIQNESSPPPKTVKILPKKTVKILDKKPKTDE